MLIMALYLFYDCSSPENAKGKKENEEHLNENGPNFQAFHSAESLEP